MINNQLRKYKMRDLCQEEKTHLKKKSVQPSYPGSTSHNIPDLITIINNSFQSVSLLNYPTI